MKFKCWNFLDSTAKTINPLVHSSPRCLITMFILLAFSSLTQIQYLCEQIFFISFGFCSILANCPISISCYCSLSMISPRTFCSTHNPKLWPSEYVPCRRIVHSWINFWGRLAASAEFRILSNCTVGSLESVGWSWFELSRCSRASAISSNFRSSCFFSSA